MAAAAGLKNLEIIKREKLCENAREVGAYFQQRIKSLYDIPIVRDVRVKTQHVERVVQVKNCIH